MVKPILIIGPSWVGDMVMAQSLFITLKQQKPERPIDVLAPAWSSGLLARMPQVRSSLVMPLTHGQFGWTQRRRLGKSLRTTRYGQALVLPNSWKSALVPFFADIPQRTGYIGECRWGLLNDARRLRKPLLPMTVQRFVALAVALPDDPMPPICPPPKLQVTPAMQAAALARFNLSPSGKILALCPGAEYGEAKRWPSPHFAAVAAAKIRAGWQVWLFGAKQDQAAAKAINQATDNACVDLTGRTQLADAVDLLSLADAVVTNDSGLMHVAAALDKTLIAVYGSSDAKATPPLNPKAQIVSLNLPCAPCFRRVCPLGHTGCLNGISPEHVLTLLPP